MAYLGVDIHSNKFTAHFKEGDGKGRNTVYIVDEPIRKLRSFLRFPQDGESAESIFTSYNFINKEMTMVKNRIPSLFRQNLKSCSDPTDKELLENDLASAALDEAYEIQVRLLAGVLEQLLKVKAAIKKAILLLGESCKEDIDISVSISGISIFGALGLISDYATVA